MVATECSTLRWAVADVVCSDGKQLIETEVKISIEDFNFDFTDKCDKHKEYQKGQRTEWFNDLVPTKMFYAVPEEFIPYVHEKLKLTPYGLLMIKNGNRYSRSVKVVKKASTLNSVFPKRAYESLLSRMGSEIVNCWIKITTPEFAPE